MDNCTLLLKRYSRYFKERVKNNAWEKREAQLIEKSEKIFVQFAKRNKGDLIGYCICTISKVDKEIGEIDSIFIKEPHRKSGLGKQLMKNALEWFKSNQTRTLTLLVGIGNEEVIKYYQQFGFNPIHIVMKKE